MLTEFLHFCLLMVYKKKNLSELVFLLLRFLCLRHQAVRMLFSPLRYSDEDKDSVLTV